MNKKQDIDKFFTERDKILGKILLSIFFVFVIVVNWTDIFIFTRNLQAVPYLVQEKVDNIPIIGSTAKDKKQSEKDKDSNNDSKIIEKETEENDTYREYCEENRITISAISISAPIIEAEGESQQDYESALNKGVLLFPYSQYPGEKGLTVLLGHSAPLGWPNIRYDRVFTEIDQLQEGDFIDICYNNKLYEYIVINENPQEKLYGVGEEVPPLYIEENKRELVIMTCWPPGDDAGRIGIRAVEY